jgi:hypothetical protein
MLQFGSMPFGVCRSRPFPRRTLGPLIQEQDGHTASLDTSRRRDPPNHARLNAGLLTLDRADLPATAFNAVVLHDDITGS